MAHTNSCVCESDWRFIACHLITGLPKAVLHPVSVDWEVPLNEVGTGTMTLGMRDVNIRDVWPHATVIYIARVNGPRTGTSETPYGEFAGLVETVEATGGGSLSIGMKSIEGYLDYRLLPKRSFRQVSQTSIAATLVNYQRTNGIKTLTPATETSAIKRDRTYNAYDYKIIGEAIRDLTQVIDGPDYELMHQMKPYSNQVKGAEGRVWQTQIVFRDYVGDDRGIRLTSDVEALAYSLGIDAATQANSVTAVGEGEAEAQLHSHVEDLSLYPALYPEYEAAPAWSDVTIQRTLDEHAAGYLEDYLEPVATPGVTIYGLDPDPSLVRVGDSVQVHVDAGAVTFHGTARIQSISWNLSDGAPPSRELELLPNEPPSESVYMQEAGRRCDEC